MISINTIEDCNQKSFNALINLRQLDFPGFTTYGE